MLSIPLAEWMRSTSWRSSCAYSSRSCSIWTDCCWATCPPIFPDCVSLVNSLPGEEGRGALMTRADVIVIGGGANGTSTAFHLASRGVKNVLLLERRHLGAGATGKSGSLVRMHYTNEAESRLAFESLKVFRDRKSVGEGKRVDLGGC